MSWRQTRALAALLLALGVCPPVAAQVAVGTTVNATPGVGTNTGASPSITTPTTNPVIAVSIGIFDAIGGTTITGLTLTGFTGTSAMKAQGFIAGGSDMTLEVWCVTAPTANTAGTVQANFSGSVSYTMSVTTYSGAHQTTPCPTGAGNVVTDLTATDPQTLDPANATANEVTHGAAMQRAGGQDLDAVTPNGLYLVNHAHGGTDNSLATGYATGGTGVTFGVTATDAYIKAAIRIVVAAGGAAASPKGTLVGVLP